MTGDFRVDCDSHVIEPFDLWLNYMEPELRDWAVQFRDPLASGRLWEMNVIDGRPTNPPAWRNAGVKMERRKGCDDSRERLEVLDDQNVDACILYPSLELFFGALIREPNILGAVHRAYNRWLADFVRDSGGRLVGVARIDLGDVDLAISELHRSVDDGLRGVTIPSHISSREPHGSPDHDRFWSALAETGYPLILHPDFEEAPPLANRFFPNMRGASFHNITMSKLGLQSALATFFQFGTFDRVPGLKIMICESGGGWIGPFIDQLDGKYGVRWLRENAKLANRPSEYLRNHIVMQADPHERTIIPFMEIYDLDFVWGADYPHPEAPKTVLDDLEQMAAAIPGEQRRRRFLGETAAELFAIPTSDRLVRSGTAVR